MSTVFLETTDTGLSFMNEAGPFVSERGTTISNTAGNLPAALSFAGISGASLSNFGRVEGTGIGVHANISESVIHNENGTIEGSDVGLKFIGLANTLVNATFSVITGDTAVHSLGFNSHTFNS